VLRLRRCHLRWQKNPRGVATPKGGGLHRPGPSGRKTLKESRSGEAHSRLGGETFRRDEAGLLGSNAPRSVQVHDGSQSFQDDQGPGGVGSSRVMVRWSSGREPHASSGRKPCRMG